MPSLWHSLSVFQSFRGFDYSPGSCLFQQPVGTFHGFWFFQGGFWYCFCCCVWLLMGLLFSLRMDFSLFWGIWRRGWVNSRIHCGWVDCCLGLDKRWCCCCRFHLDSVPSDRGAMSSMNSVGPSVVFLYYFLIGFTCVLRSSVLVWSSLRPKINLCLVSSSVSSL